MRLISTYHSCRDDWKTLFSLAEYLKFMMGISDHSRVVFADEKPMKGKDIYGKVRRNVMTGNTPAHKMIYSAKIRLNILAAVTVKGRSTRPVEYFILEKVSTNSQIFLQFVRRLLSVGTLRTWDIFVVDNCSVHIQGDNIGLRETLLRRYGILMITLPPYHPELNPTELVLNTLVMRLRSLRARYRSADMADFKTIVRMVLDNISLEDVTNFYNFCGYYF